MKRVYDRCLNIELLESVEICNGFECRRECLNVSVREASVEDSEGAFDTHPTRPLFDALFDALLYSELMTALFAEFNDGCCHVDDLLILCMLLGEDTK